MADFRTIPQVVAYAAKQALIECMRMGRCRSTPIVTIEAKSQALADEARRLGSILFVPMNQTGPTYVTVGGARQAVRLSQEPPLYPNLSPGGNAFLLESWLIRALTEHFSSVASALVLLGVPFIDTFSSPLLQ